MSDNPQYGTAPLFGLPGLRVIALQGRDAVAFAQSQFMNDVAALDDLHWQWSGWLDPKGRVQALFALIRIEAETIWLLTTATPDLEVALARYVFRSKVRIGPAGVQAIGQLAAPPHARGAKAARDADALELDLSGDGASRTLRLSAARASTLEALEARWWSLDIVHGWPGLPGVRLADWTPQQLSLQRLQAFSVKKGCYPGQEIVARTHFLGRAKRGLARIGVADAHPGDALSDASGRDVGNIVCAIGGDALAVIPLEAGDAPLQLHGAPVALLPLTDGLAR